MKQQEFFDLLEKYERKKCTRQEKKFFDDFCEELNKYPDLWESWELTHKDKVRLQIYTKMHQRIKRGPSVRKSRMAVIWRIAASIVLLIGLEYAGYRYLIKTPEVELVTMSTESGQRSKIALADGTVIQLNEESSISFPKTFSPTERVINLSGEAFFEVAKDSSKPFTVKTGNLKTTVLGTTFNIQAYPKDEGIRVTVATGKVKVANEREDTGTGLILYPSEQGIYNRVENSMEKKTVDLDEYVVWKEDVIHLDKKTLLKTTQILSKWYNVEFQFGNEAIKNCSISGELKRSSLENLLKNIKFFTGIDYLIEPNNKIVLSGESCTKN